jgi:CheY-like chemotaxis protein
MRQTVLIIDDEPDIREIIEISLLSEDCDVLMAANRDEAWKLIKQHGLPDVILMDYSMSGMPAEDFVNEIVRISKPPRMILMTAAADAHARARELGVPEVLPKPFELENMLAHTESSANAWYDS